MNPADSMWQWAAMIRQSNQILERVEALLPKNREVLMKKLDYSKTKTKGCNEDIIMSSALYCAYLEGINKFCHASLP